MPVAFFERKRSMKKLRGDEILGIEFGSTRIKAVLTDRNCRIIAQGSYSWENELLDDGIWTYGYDRIVTGLRECYADLNTNVETLFASGISSLGAIGISGMMHGYIPLDENDRPLVPFRTWRNTITGQAAKKLTGEFRFNIPQRWSVAHLYQAFLNKEEHIGRIRHLTTLAGYVHFLLSGKKIVGIGEASGLFPVDSETLTYDAAMAKRFDELCPLFSDGIISILPTAVMAGENAGFLTEAGAALIDPGGSLRPGAVMAPPEGDAGTGMVATNSIRPKTGNVSAGTSIFSMVVLEKPLDSVHEEIDVVSTPDGKDVAMIHCNNCCNDIDKWVEFFGDVLERFGTKRNKSELYERFYSLALDGEEDCGGLTAMNYFSGEPVAGLSDGRPMLIREKNAGFTFANLARAEINSAFCTLKIGHEILEKSGVRIDFLNGHGGLFKTSDSGQRLMANALKTEIRVSGASAEGGAWGMAVLAAFVLEDPEITLEEYLDRTVFSDMIFSATLPEDPGVLGFEKYFRRFKAVLEIMKTEELNNA